MTGIRDVMCLALCAKWPYLGAMTRFEPSSGGLKLRRRGLAMLLAAVLAFPSAPALAIDPLYQPQMQRLLFVLGSLYFLQPLCGTDSFDWRQQASELIDDDQPEEDRRLRLTGSFNDGYAAYARLYRDCTESAQQATGQMLVEAETLSRDIHTRFAE